MVKFVPKKDENKDLIRQFLLEMRNERDGIGFLIGGSKKIHA